MMEGWLCPRCHKVNAPWVSQCSCEDFWRDKITCNPCTTGAYPRDNWSVITATNTDVNSDSTKTVPSV